MKTQRILSAALSLLTVFALLSPLAPAARAAEGYESGQYYLMDSANTEVYTVQVSAVKTLEAAEARRDKMLKAGFDSFVYETDGTFRIMCGKFTDYGKAEVYCETIKACTDRERAYITRAFVPDSAITAFQNADVSLPVPSADNVGSGSFQARDYAAGQSFTADEKNTEVFTVQVSAGKKLEAAEARRDQMLKAGFDSFLYETDGTYRIMCGKFTDMAKADAYCTVIKARTDRDRAYVTRAMLPKDAISEFWTTYSGGLDGTAYADFIRDGKWADQLSDKKADADRAYLFDLNGDRKDECLLVYKADKSFGFMLFTVNNGEIELLADGACPAPDEMSVYFRSVKGKTGSLLLLPDDAADDAAAVELADGKATVLTGKDALANQDQMQKKGTLVTGILLG